MMTLDLVRLNTLWGHQPGRDWLDCPVRAETCKFRVVIVVKYFCQISRGMKMMMMSDAECRECPLDTGV